MEKQLKKAIEEASTREYLFQNATATLEERATKLSIANLNCYIWANELHTASFFNYFDSQLLNKFKAPLIINVQNAELDEECWRLDVVG